VLVILLLAGLAIVGGVVLAALGRAGEMATFPGDGAPLELGTAGVSPADVALLRPPTALWGYQVQATEEALGAIARSMAARDAEIATLRWQLESLRGGSAAAQPAAGQDLTEPPWAPSGGQPSPWAGTSDDVSGWPAAVGDESGWARHGDEPAGSRQLNEEGAAPWNTSEAELTAWSTAGGASGTGTGDVARPAPAGGPPRAGDPATAGGSSRASDLPPAASPATAGDPVTASDQAAASDPAAGNDAVPAGSEPGERESWADGVPAALGDSGGGEGMAVSETGGQQAALDTGQDVPAARKPAGRSASRAGGTGSQRPAPPAVNSDD
jgi:hypothetical protein